MPYYHKTNSKKIRKFVKNHGRVVPVVCTKRMFGKSCKYCEIVGDLYQKGEEEKEKLASRCRARSTFYMNILDLGNKDEGLQVYGCGIELWRTLIDYLPDSTDDEDDGVDYTNPKTARKLILKKHGSGLKTKYSISVGSEVTIKKGLFKNLNDLSNILELIEKDSIKLWKPSEGKNKIYIFPPWSKDADGNFFSEVFYHWNVESLTFAMEDEADLTDDDDLNDDDLDTDVDDDDDIPF